MCVTHLHPRADVGVPSLSTRCVRLQGDKCASKRVEGQEGMHTGSRVEVRSGQMRVEPRLCLLVGP